MTMPVPGRASCLLKQDFNAGYPEVRGANRSARKISKRRCVPWFNQDNSTLYLLPGDLIRRKSF
jgi:hypothetical protein